MVFIRQSYTFIFSLLVLLLASCSAPNTEQSIAPGLVRKAYSPTWGPDGQRIAFLYRYRAEGSQEVTDGLYTVLLNGTDLVKVRSLSPARFDSASWSPGGAYFLLTTEDTQEIYLSESNGQNLEKIADGEQVHWHPFDLKFVSTYDNQCEASDRVGGRQCQRQIRLYDLASRTHLALPVSLPREVIAPSWSSDGTRLNWLMTTTEQTKEQSRRMLELHTYNIATEEYQVTEIQPTELVFSDAEWSKDGNVLAFNYLNQIRLFFLNLNKFYTITQGVEASLSLNNSKVLYTNLIGENRGDIALFDRDSESISTIISHRSLPEN